MDKIDREVLQTVQDNFPLCERPYEAMAGKLGISSELFLERLEGLLAKGYIRRIGASLDSRKFGFKGTLAALSVSEDQVERAAEIIGGYSEVTHNYLRDDVFNIWFTIIAENQKRIDSIIEEIRRELSLDDDKVLNLPASRQFKLNARFKVLQ